MKTILKLYDSGKLETLNTSLVQSSVANNYKFTENAITIPKIIEYPPLGYRNYFIEKTSEIGYVNTWSDEVPEGSFVEPNEDDRTSDFIDVRGWTSATVRVRFKNRNEEYWTWVGITSYNSSKQYQRALYDDYVSTRPDVGDYTFTTRLTGLTNVSFIRVSVNYYDTPNVEVKISVEQGDTSNTKHYLAPEDIPEWAKDTGNPISIFPEGVVIKGDLVQTNT